MKVKCPSCEKWIEWKGNPHRPFCGEQCKWRDLGKWASEEYRIPVGEDGEGEKKEEE